MWRKWGLNANIENINNNNNNALVVQRRCIIKMKPTQDCLHRKRLNQDTGKMHTLETCNIFRKKMEPFYPLPCHNGKFVFILITNTTNNVPLCETDRTLATVGIQSLSNRTRSAHKFLYRRQKLFYLDYWCTNYRACLFPWRGHRLKLWIIRRLKL